MGKKAAKREEDPRAYFPAFLDLCGQRCVVVGGGVVAARKCAALLKARAEVIAVAPEFCAALRRMKNVKRRERAFRASDVRGAVLVIAATDRRQVNECVAALARRQRCLVNVVDRPELCTLVVPSVIRRGRLTVAISTGGLSPALARRLRQQLEGVLPAGYGGYLRALGRLREEMKGLVCDAAERRAILTRAASEDAYEAFQRGGVAAFRKAVGFAVPRRKSKCRPCEK